MGNEFKAWTAHSAEHFGDTRDHWWNLDFLQLMAKRWKLDAVRARLESKRQLRLTAYRSPVARTSDRIGMMIEALAQNLGLGSLLDQLRSDFGGYDILHHWQRGEFHHDLVVQVKPECSLPGSVLVVATNCNGGVKEILCFAQVPEHDALWHHRCPENPEFVGEVPPILAAAHTVHWFDPCELLGPDARSEYLPEHRERQPGGGWQPKGCGVNGKPSTG